MRFSKYVFGAMAGLLSSVALAAGNLAIQPDRDGLYVGVHGGAAWITPVTYSPWHGGPANIRVLYHTGWVGDGSFGYYYHGFSADLSGYYIRANNRQIVGGTAPASPPQGFTMLTAGLVNMGYMYDQWTHWMPYGGAGVGWAHISNNVGNASGTLLVHSADTRFAYQLYLGLGYAFNEHWLLGLDGHALRTFQGHFKPQYRGVQYQSREPIYTRFVQLGLSYLF